MRRVAAADTFCKKLSTPLAIPNAKMTLKTKDSHRETTTSAAVAHCFLGCWAQGLFSRIAAVLCPNMTFLHSEVWSSSLTAPHRDMKNRWNRIHGRCLPSLWWKAHDIHCNMSRAELGQWRCHLQLLPGDSMSSKIQHSSKTLP